NMIFLWAFGPEIEDAMGRVRYLFFYLIGGVVAMAAQVLGKPHLTDPNVGASGAIPAAMGSVLVPYPLERVVSASFFLGSLQMRSIPAALLIGFWFLTQLVSLGTVATVQQGGVAYLAHVGGFLYGALWTRVLVRASRVQEPAG